MKKSESSSMHLRYCIDCKQYTLKRLCPKCAKPSNSAHPARFSPDDKYSRHRVTIKKRFGVLPTQQENPGPDLTPHKISIYLLHKQGLWYTDEHTDELCS